MKQKNEKSTHFFIKTKRLQSFIYQGILVFLSSATTKDEIVYHISGQIC